MNIAEQEKNKNNSPLLMEKVEELARNFPEWIIENAQMHREFIFRDFLEAIDFVNRVAAAAEAEDHHPDIFISYNKVRLNLSTHQAGGLTVKDFLLAGEIDSLAEETGKKK
ncbi:MAG: 4a-hydroxytetrahydrobiopterin dehydratase [Candidatus Latescibacterota bacterium]